MNAYGSDISLTLSRQFKVDLYESKCKSDVAPDGFIKNATEYLYLFTLPNDKDQGKSYFRVRFCSNIQEPLTNVYEHN